ncbi:MAG: S9 family peptidase [Balneolaceae bacterium]|nr:S9 family peptidase [Balneolaceae bacterium]
MNLRYLLRSLLAVLLLTAASTGLHAQTQELTREQILQGNWDGILQSMPRIVTWTDDSHFVMAVPQDGNGGQRVLVNAATGEQQNYEPEEQEPQRQVGIRAGDLYLLEGEAQQRLTETDAQENNPTLSPDGSKVAFTRDRDLYVIELDSGEEQRLTDDGSEVIYNGWSSWVYMEEILGRSTNFKAYWWSPDSERLAFFRTDDRPVQIFPIHGVVELESVQDSYGTLIEQRYPKSGSDNPNVRVGVAELSSGEITWADFDPTGDHYFGMPYWTPSSDALWVQWMNRDQDHLVIYEIDLADGSRTPVYEERQETWIDLDSGDRLQFLDDGAGFLMMSDQSGWMHLYHYDMEGNLVSQVTSGEWTLTDVERVNQETGWVYFTARRESSARIDLYKVRMDGTGLQRLTFGEYTHSVNVSPDGSYFTTSYSNAATPTRLAVLNDEGDITAELTDSKGPEFDDYNLARTEIFRVPSGDGHQLPVEVTWPMNLDENGSYPVLISIYGGPGSTGVWDRWGGLGMNQWWAKEGLIQVSMDHRGSGHFGKEGKNWMHRDLGRWEIADYTTIVEWLQEEYPFIDPDRIGITGFSYGGYVSSLALTWGAGTFDFGLAGGSVTDWHLYDTHYTERYMDRPQDNPDGYESSSVMSYVDRYEDDSFLLMVHGTMDDNVHLQNTLQLVSALESAGKDFEFIPYIGGKHGWYNLPGKQRHYQHQRYKFYYRYLLEQPVSGMLMEN